MIPDPCPTDPCPTDPCPTDPCPTDPCLPEPFLLAPPSRPAAGLDASRPAPLAALPLAARLKAWKARAEFAAGRRASPLPLFEATGTVFVRVPKNASNALMRYLYPPGAELPHYGADFYRRVLPDAFARHLVFAPVRHPIERFASAFAYLKEVSRWPQNRRLMDETYGFIDSFADFVAWLNDQPDLEAVEIMRWHHFRPQKEFLCDPAGRVIVDLAFPVEDTGPGLAVLARQAGRSGDLPVANASRKPDLAGLDLGRIAAHYADDLRLWQAVSAARAAAFTAKGRAAVAAARPDGAAA
jgi:hypothetical protein